MNGQKKTLLYCWELGVGNGHIGPFEPIARRFIDAGWHVAVAVRTLSRVPSFLDHSEITVLQAPFKDELSSQHVALPQTFGQMLENVGYGNTAELTVLVKAWQGLLNYVKPDLLLVDHSPTVLIAARGRSLPQFTLGTGFFVPIDQQPIANLTPWWETSAEIRLKQEQVLTDRVNQVLQQLRLPELPRLAAIFSGEVVNLFTTFAELDANFPRPCARYFGALQPSTRSPLPAPPPWPKFPGPKVFVYMRSSPYLHEILQVLGRRRVPTIAVIDNQDLRSLTQEVGPTLTLLDRPVSLDSLVTDCDMTINFGGHGTVSRFLHAGVPQVIFPIAVEHGINSYRVQALNAGIFARQRGPDAVSGPIQQLLDHPDQFYGATEFQKKYAAWSQSEAVEEIYRCISNNS